MSDKEEDPEKSYTGKDKWIVSIMSGLLFLIIASPFLYSAVNSLSQGIGFTTANGGCPNMTGLILHSIVFVLVVRLIMW